MDNKEAKKILKLLNSADVTSHNLGLSLIQTQNDFGTIQKAIEEQIVHNYSPLTHQTLFKYTGSVDEKTISSISKNIAELLEMKRQKMAFKHRTQKMKQGEVINTFSSWLFHLLQSYIEQDIEFVFNQNQQLNLQYLTLIKEPLPSKNILAKVKELDNINLFLTSQGGNVQKRALKKQIVNPSACFNLDKITSFPISFMVFPKDKSLEKWFCIQKITLDLT
ncbi:hypothetical protein [uncultured Microscilla sp.]|uniref:hypothetical protein n=1 Tax=uncultured Microscilla sp. TaxID=432653 RepID=UPI0026193F9B|nr:hypothetical protein [uncultured Microscilla sp.]